MSDPAYQLQLEITRAVGQIRANVLTAAGNAGAALEVSMRDVLGNTSASSSGSPPARRTGAFRNSWHATVADNGSRITVQLRSDSELAPILQYGTAHMAPRPFIEVAAQRALPGIIRAFSDLSV